MKDERHSSWQTQYFEMLGTLTFLVRAAAHCHCCFVSSVKRDECHFLWPGQYLVMLQADSAVGFMCEEESA